LTLVFLWRAEAGPATKPTIAAITIVDATVFLTIFDSPVHAGRAKAHDNED
jgi:hypothetical protein